MEEQEFKTELKPDFKRAVNTNKMELFSIYDTKAEKFGFPFQAASKGAAVRQIAVEMNGQKNVLTQYPQDFELYAVEEFYEKTGTFAGYKKPVFIMNLKDILQAQ